MAKKKKKTCPPLALWLVTFSDLTTLLLTFFVLLLSMSSMDNSLITTVTLTTGDLGLLDKRGSGRASAKERLVAELMDKPWEVLDKKDRIKDLLFPDEILPPDIDRQELDRNLDILAKPDGVALVFTDNLLFDPGSGELSIAGRALIDQLVPLLSLNPAPVNIAGYTDSTEDAPYALSGDRALAVLAYLVQAGIPDRRFSLSAYGAAFPVIDRYGNPLDTAMNRRVEILLKTARPVGGYI
ncbi:OmpA/MotB family protein [Pseudodesulfovibrio tunisiensis]|uniref:OmpA/MotB family protein n=1 Tax=Pseudodesulfovibrio tunisiensis TaxID=463192 RepID=UPI001FB20F28|nr:flagellar motor protein MotB [Pseudodesulfovibrio tunisiensis]